MITKILAPQINANDDGVEIAAWHVESGAYVECGQDIADLETSKTTVTLSAERAGYIRCLAPARAMVCVGTPILAIASSAEELDTLDVQQGADAAAGDAREPAADEISVATNGAGHFSSARFSRAAAQLLEAHRLQPERFRGGGLITADRVRQALGLDGASRRSRDREPQPERASPATAAPAPTARSERISSPKRAEIEALSLGESGNINSTLSILFESADIRSRLRQEHMFDGSPQPLLLYELARLLKEWPQLTAFYEGEAIHYFGRVDLGLAMDLGKGLKVVTIRNADQLTPLQLFERTLELGMRYIENRLEHEQLTGSTLTVTDLSGFDVLQFHPLINGRQSAIIGIGGDQTLPGHPMTINVTFDHRVASGRDVSLFLNALRSRLRSYAPPSVGDAPERLTVSPACARQEAHGSVACDRCGVDPVSYYSNYPRDGYMLAYYKADGSLGRVCHRCHGSWN